MRPKGTGSRSPFTSRHLCGTDTIFNTGAWTTHQEQHTTVGSLDSCVCPRQSAGLHSRRRSANKINPEWVALDSSRGIETPSSKVFMRATSLISDLLIYLPSLYFFVRTWLGSRSSYTQHTVLLALLLQPALILIDSGHFQYNSVMLGFTILALNFFFSGHDLLGAVCFVLSLCFKQMALYYSPAIFAYLLGKCLLLGPTRGYACQQSMENLYADFL